MPTMIKYKRMPNEKERKDMSLQFILGRANTNKREVMLDEVSTLLANEPDASIFYIVPEHMTFSAEMNVMSELSKKPLFKDRPIMGMIQLQVYSFSRLAWYFLQDSTIFNQTQLTDAGVSMLVRKIIQEWEEELTIFRGESHHSGFIQRVTEILLELRSGDVTVDDLDEMVNQLSDYSKTEDTILKLKDISLIYQAFNQALIGKYLEREELMETLIKKIQYLDLSNTYIYVESFHHFSAKEQRLLIEFMKRTKKVSIALTLDEPYTNQKPDKLDLFYQTGETYFKLYQMARSANIPIAFDITHNEIDKGHSPFMNALENYWVQTHQADERIEKDIELPENHAIEVWKSESKQAEVVHVANKIRQLTSNGDMRYRDILILARDIDDYRSILVPLFKENEIEVFVDKAEKMSNHPLVEMLMSLLAIHKNYWRYHDILRFLRTELFVPLEKQTAGQEKWTLEQLKESAQSFREKVDVTENVVLAYGYEGRHWTNKKDWSYTTFAIDEMSEPTDEDKRIEGIANEVKNVVFRTLNPFFKKIKKAKTNTQAAQELYEFLEQIGVTQQLLYWRDEAIEEGDLDTARKHEQVWKTFIKLLDEFVDVLGDEEWTLDTFLTILETGFENASYSIVPPQIDQVILSDFTNVQPGTSKVVFMLGMTDQNLPINVENHSVLTEEERGLLTERLDEGKSLRPLSEDLVATEPFLAYKAFMNACDQLIFTYPIKNDGSEDNKISPYIKQIMNYLKIEPIFKASEAINLLHMDTDEEEEREALLSFIGSPRATLSQLLLIMRQAKEENQVPSVFWYQLFQYFHKHYHDNAIVTRLLASLEKKNIPKRLPSKLAEGLYGEDLYLSVSQLETFYLDPFSHFLRYGLRLRERTEQELTPAGTGSFFHDALDKIFQTIIQKDILLKDVSQTELMNISDEVLQQLFVKDSYRVLTVTNQMTFVRRQLAKTIHRMMWAMVKQSQGTNMKTAQTEVLFGRLGAQKGIQGLEYPLNNNGKLYLRGKIDRVDVLETDKKLFLSVVDYKSSAHSIDFADLYNGTALQMMTYLDTALSNSEQLFGKKAEPAGAFYSHVKNPFIKWADKSDEDKLQKELLKQHKLDGLIIEEEELLEKLDHSIEGSEYSQIYPYRRVKTGFSSKKFITKDELDVMQGYNRKLIVDAGNDILSGKIDLLPYKDKRKFTPSVGGEYHAISQFDVLLDENFYRTPSSLKEKSDIIAQMKKRLNKEEKK